MLGVVDGAEEVDLEKAGSAVIDVIDGPGNRPAPFIIPGDLTAF